MRTGGVTSKFLKHVYVKYHFLIDHVEKGDVDLHYAQTDKMIADMFARNLKRVKFCELAQISHMI